MFDPKSTPRTSRIDASSSLPLFRKKSHPWAWLVGLVVTLLLVWGFFLTDHLKVGVDPVTTPAALEATVD
ncbi:MAG: hypothetical protein ABI114_17390 [Rhodanobacter sp.]